MRHETGTEPPSPEGAEQDATSEPAEPVETREAPETGPAPKPPTGPQGVGGTGFLTWSAVLYLVLAVAAIVWLGSRHGRIGAALFVDPEAWAVDVAAGLGAAAALLGLWRLTARLYAPARRLERSMAELVGPLEWAEVVSLALLSGFAEELFFRGAVQGAWGLPVATLLFAALHVGPGREYRLWTLFALVAGAVLGGLMAWRGNLLAPVLAHVGVNAVGLSRIAALARRARA